MSVNVRLFEASFRLVSVLRSEPIKKKFAKFAFSRPNGVVTGNRGHGLRTF